MDGENEVRSIWTVSSPMETRPERHLAQRKHRRLHWFASAVVGTVIGFGGVSRADPSLIQLASFNGPNGADPQGSLVVDADGNLFGTTQGNVTYNTGTAFEISAGTHTFSTLVTFGGSAGQYPYAGLCEDSLGNLYGTTIYGPGGSGGTVFEIAGGLHAFSTLAVFQIDQSYGEWPYGGVIVDGSGNLYGTTFSGGAVYEVPAGTNTILTLAHTPGNSPRAGVVADAAGNLYGTTQGGPSAGTAGTVFKVAAGTPAVSTLAVFNHTNGAYPESGVVVDSEGNIFGCTTEGGTYDYGTVFEIPAATGVLQTLVSFNLTNGGDPYGSLIIDAAGNLYGTTQTGGPNRSGTIFKISADTHILTTLVSSFGSGEWPEAGLVADADGNLYGTTTTGGPDVFGTVFEVTGSGFVTSAPEPSAIMACGALSLCLLGRRRFFCSR